MPESEIWPPGSSATCNSAALTLTSSVCHEVGVAFLLPVPNRLIAVAERLG
jgi:hypothetical protein